MASMWGVEDEKGALRSKRMCKRTTVGKGVMRWAGSSEKSKRGRKAL